MSCNLLETLPASVGTLMFLEHLDVSGNALEDLPSVCGNQSLVRLDASDNRLARLPEDLSECPKLRQLVVNGNDHLAALPQDLGLFQPELGGVWARGCGLTALPSALEAASGLTDLDVGRNRLRLLPPALGGGGGRRAGSLGGGGQGRTGASLSSIAFFSFVVCLIEPGRVGFLSFAYSR